MAVEAVIRGFSNPQTARRRTRKDIVEIALLLTSATILQAIFGLSPTLRNL